MSLAQSLKSYFTSVADEMPLDSVLSLLAEYKHL